MARRLFGTDGIRGTANQPPMTAEMALRLGMAAGRHFTRGDHRHRVVIGKDTRLSGYMLEPALTAGFIAMGMDVTLLGPAADAGGRDAHALAARRPRGHDLRLAQSVPGQRHQAVRPRRLQAVGRDRAGDRGRHARAGGRGPREPGPARAGGAPGGRARPLHGGAQGEPAARVVPGRSEDRGRFRQRRRLRASRPSCCGSSAPR